MNYVNPMIQLASQFLGVADATLPGVYGDLGRGDWSGLQNKDIHNKITYRQAVAYYVNSETQISDNFSNASRKPKVAEDINGYGDMAREIQFLVGAGKAATGLKGNALTPGNDSNQQVQSLQNIEEFTGDILGSGNFIDALAGNVATVMMGGRLMFPDIWTDSSFMRSYNIQFKFRCPNPDPLSWIIDIWAPLAHLLPFAIPKAMGPNGYVAPFIMRAYHSGMFNVQMGLCTSMSITRGDVGDWTINNLPCSVDVSMEIKDLYDVLNISSEGDSQYSIMNNIGLLDYIANFCGIDINQPDMSRMVDYYYYKTTGIGNRLRQNIVNSLDEWASNKAMNMFKI